MNSSFSVLLSVYCKEKPQFLREALNSVFGQSLRANEVVLVEDGALTPDLDSVIADFLTQYPELKIVQLKQNEGLGKALNVGLAHCTYDLVARMDTDDVCKPERFARQVSFFEQHPEVDICSSWIDEFSDSPMNVISVKCLPRTHQELFAYGKRRNPINHPAAMFRKSSVLAVGGYKHFYLFEDYYLWARMMMKGYKFANLQESLLFFRMSPSMLNRRRGWRYIKSEFQLQYTFHSLGYISFSEMLSNMLVRFVARILPFYLFRSLYENFLRN